MFGVLRCIIKLVHHLQGVRQPVSIRISSIKHQRGQVEGPQAVSADIVSRNQGRPIYSSIAGVRVIRAVRQRA
jgi:hypothetical protein